ncbi:MAG: amidase [Bdellovibrionota bacterium]
MSLYEKPITELSSLLTEKQITSVELTKIFLDRIDQTNPTLNSFLTISHDIALADAAAADQKIQSGQPTHPLCGIPVGIKDIICTQDIKTTGASKILENFVPSYDATVIAHLREISAVRIGKTNCDEFAMGSSNENSAFANCKNPWDLSCVPGGSSGGSAAAVSSRQTPTSLGTDTGGSIRQPASLCGIVGIKPTYGRVSRFGSMAFASSLDQIGPFANTIEDAAIVLDAISQNCTQDSTYQGKPYNYVPKHIHAEIKDKTIGVDWAFIEAYASDEVLANFKQQIAFLNP